MLRRACIVSVLAGSAVLALPSIALAETTGGFRPARFQVDGWVSTCTPGTDGFAAECVATKKMGAYTLSLSVGDDQFYQVIEHPGCEYESNNVFRDEAPMSSGDEQRRWIVTAFDKIARKMAKRCPKLPPLDRQAYQEPPNLNDAGDRDLSAPVRPPRFQVGGWVTTCWPGVGDVGPRCEALKKVGGYRLQMIFEDERISQSLERPPCQEQSYYSTDKLSGATPEDRRRWTVQGFQQLQHDMAKSCPKVLPLDRKALLNSPDPNITREDGLR